MKGTRVKPAYGTGPQAYSLFAEKPAPGDHDLAPACRTDPMSAALFIFDVQRDIKLLARVKAADVLDLGLMATEFGP